MTTITSDFSECYTIQSDPIAASVIEDKYLWWPVGVKWPPSPPALVETSTNVTILKNVPIIYMIIAVADLGRFLGFHRTPPPFRLDLLL